MAIKLLKYTEQELRDAVKNSKSVRNVLKLLNICEAGGNYQTFYGHIKHFNIDISHFTGKVWNKGQHFGPKRPIEDYLNNKHFIHSYKLKNRLIREKFFKYQCQKCKKRKWLGDKIPLELHHKDGNHLNNNLSNLEILCPNCHALTDNYRGNKLKKCG